MAVVQHIGAQENSSYARLYVGAVESQYQTLFWHDNPYYKEGTCETILKTIKSFPLEKIVQKHFYDIPE